LVVSSQKTKQIDNTPKPILTLTPAEKRRHNSTNKIINNVLTTPALKPIKADKKQQTKSTKSPSKALKKQPIKSTRLPTQQTRKSLIDMTTKELLAYAKKEKIRGYSSVYKTQKKLGLIKLIEQQPEFSE
jgi:hypothetical protein